MDTSPGRTRAHLAEAEDFCNGHYNRTPDLGKWVMRWDNVGLSKYTILDTKVLDRNVTWPVKHKDTS